MYAYLSQRLNEFNVDILYFNIFLAFELWLYVSDFWLKSFSNWLNDSDVYNYHLAFEFWSYVSDFLLKPLSIWLNDSDVYNWFLKTLLHHIF